MSASTRNKPGGKGPKPFLRLTLPLPQLWPFRKKRGYWFSMVLCVFRASKGSV